MIYCGGCSKTYRRNPGMCSNCGCIEFTTNPALAQRIEDADPWTQKAIRNFQNDPAVRRRAGFQADVYGSGHVYRSQDDIDSKRLK